MYAKGCKTKCAKARGQCVGACGGCRWKRDSKDEDEEREGEGSEKVQIRLFFLGDENGARVPFLVGRKRVTGMAMASPGLSAAMKVLEFVKECGAAESDIILKTDHELVIEAQMSGAEIEREEVRGEGRSVGRRGVKQRHAGTQRPGREEKS